MRIPENILEVKVAGEYFGFDGDTIQQILRVPSITPIPLSGSIIRGVVSLGGRIITVIDLGIVLGYSPVDANSQESRILTFSNRHDDYALLVESTEDMGAVDSENYEIIDNNEELISGFYRHNDHICQIIDIKKICEDISLESFTPLTLENAKDETIIDEKDRETSSIDRYLFVKLDKEQYALHLDITREILFVPESFTPVTDAKDEVIGMFTLRDKLFTAVDLSKVFGFCQRPADVQHRLVIVANEGRSIALLVDEVIDVRDIDSRDLEKMQDHPRDTKIEALYKSETTVVSFIDNMFIKNLIHAHFVQEQQHKLESENNEKGEEMVEVVVFGIDKEEYALDIDSVQEIIKYCEITPIPEAPEFVEGMINLRGSVIPILSLPDRLGFSKQVTQESKILVTIIGDEKIGLFVDEVKEILCVDDRYISKSKSENSLFSEILNLNDAKRIILKLRESSIIDPETLGQIQLEEDALV